MTKLEYPLLICSYKLFDYCKSKYVNRKIDPDMHVDHDYFYYWNRKGKFRVVINKNTIWVYVDYPYMKRIWPRAED